MTFIRRQRLQRIGDVGGGQPVDQRSEFAGLIALLGILHHLRIEQAVGEGIIAQQQGENAGSVIRALPGAVLDGKRHGMNS